MHNMEPEQELVPRNMAQAPHMDRGNIEPLGEQRASPSSVQTIQLASACNMGRMGRSRLELAHKLVPVHKPGLVPEHSTVLVQVRSMVLGQERSRDRTCSAS